MDTCAYVRLLAGNKAVFESVSTADTVYMPIFVIGELQAGFHGGSRIQENQKILMAFLRKPTVKILNTTLETADIFGGVKSRLKAAGTPIPINDVWIASQAIETGSVVVTFDAHFNLIPGIRILHLS